MPMMQVPEAFAAVTGATAKGVVSVASTTPFYPGAFAWLMETAGADKLRARIQILQVLSATQLLCRRVANDNEVTAQPHYGASDLSAWAATSTINMEQQLVPYDPAFVKHAVP